MAVPPGGGCGGLEMSVSNAGFDNAFNNVDWGALARWVRLCAGSLWAGDGQTDPHGLRVRACPGLLLPRGGAGAGAARGPVL